MMETLGVGPHGHVVPRPDGIKARCGGPAICVHCAREYFEVHGKKHPGYESVAEPILEPSQSDVDYVTGREPDAEDMLDKHPGDSSETAGEPTEFEQRAAAMHMALRMNEIRGYAGVGVVEKLIEEADKIYAFLRGES